MPWLFSGTAHIVPSENKENVSRPLPIIFRSYQFSFYFVNFQLAYNLYTIIPDSEQ